MYKRISLGQTDNSEIWEKLLDLGVHLEVEFAVRSDVGCERGIKENRVTMLHNTNSIV